MYVFYGNRFINCTMHVITFFTTALPFYSLKEESIRHWEWLYKNELKITCIHVHVRLHTCTYVSMVWTLIRHEAIVISIIKGCFFLLQCSLTDRQVIHNLTKPGAEPEYKEMGSNLTKVIMLNLCHVCGIHTI